MAYLGNPLEMYRSDLKFFTAVVSTLIELLYEKGVLDQSEFNARFTRLEAEADQQWEAIQREANADAISRNPNLKKIADEFGIEIPLPVEDE